MAKANGFEVTAATPDSERLEKIVLFLDSIDELMERPPARGPESMQDVLIRVSRLLKAGERPR